MAARRPKIDRDGQRRLQLAEAVARERVLELRTAQVLELIDLVKGKLDPTRALEIYARVHNLKEADLRGLGDRVLASLAQRGEAVLDLDALDSPEEDARSKPMLAELRRRLRGRVNTELRQQVELHTGRSQVLLLKLHVDQAVRFLEAVPEEWPIGDAVELYARRLGLEDPLPTTLYYFVLDRLASSRLRLPHGKSPSGDPGSHSLRVISGS